MNITWNAEQYDSNFSFVGRYGEAVVELLDIPQGSRVLDLGCGTGSLTRELQAKGWQVTGMDASPEQLEIARRTSPEIPFFQGDATDFSLAEPVDAVFSNAVLHWIDENRQPDLLRCVHDALKPGGQFVFECGGYGCTRRIHEALAHVFSQHGLPYQMPFYFPTIGEYAPLLEKAGLRVQYAILFDRPTRLKGEHGLEEWIEMFVGIPFRVVSDPDLAAQLRREAAELLREELWKDGAWYADYVRLRMKAVRL